MSKCYDIGCLTFVHCNGIMTVYQLKAAFITNVYGDEVDNFYFETGTGIQATQSGIQPQAHYSHQNLHGSAIFFQSSK